jgi:enolase
MFNIFNGGLHAHTGMPVQEILFMPYGTTTFKEAFEIAVIVFKTVGAVIEKHNLGNSIGDEGGYAPTVNDVQKLLDILCSVIDSLGFSSSIMLALDMAASTWYNPTTHLYTVQNTIMQADELIEWYKTLALTYPLYAIEDGLSQYDWHGWQKMTAELGQTIQLVGDDLFVTNTSRIVQGIEQNVANATIIKPTQIGTITESLQAAKVAQAYDFAVIVSHRSGETEDDFIADLAIGCNAAQFKAGGLLRGERLAKYHRLLRIEEYLMTHATSSGQTD